MLVITVLVDMRFQVLGKVETMGRLYATEMFESVFKFRLSEVHIGL